MPEHGNPFEGVTEFFSELARLRSIGMRGEHLPEHGERTHASAWVPTTDILARGDDLVIRVELAGVDPGDVDLRLSHSALTVSGTRRMAESEEDVAFYIRERFYGEFRRVITLPEGTSADDITAEFDDGLVEITVAGCVPTSSSVRISLADRSDPAESRRVRGPDG